MGLGPRVDGVAGMGDLGLGCLSSLFFVHITVSHCLSVYKKLCRQRFNSASSVVVMLAWGKVTVNENSNQQSTLNLLVGQAHDG